MKLENIIRCVGVNPHYVNSNSQREAIVKAYGANVYNGGIANAYIYIPYSKELDKLVKNLGGMYPFEMQCYVHGGITYGGTCDGISEWHCPYSGVLTPDKYDAKYIVVGWDTNHYDDTPDRWTYRTIIEENEDLATQILKIINERLGV